MAQRRRRRRRRLRRRASIAVVAAIAVGACADSRDAPRRHDPADHRRLDDDDRNGPRRTSVTSPTTAPPATTAARRRCRRRRRRRRRSAPIAADAGQHPADRRHRRRAGRTDVDARRDAQAMPPTCSPAGIGADTGLLTIKDVRCRAGWAIGQLDACPQGEECEGVDVFHVTEDGWVHDGYFSVACPESLADSGMSIYTAMAFIPTFCAGDPGPTRNIPPGLDGRARRPSCRSPWSLAATTSPSTDVRAAHAGGGARLPGAATVSRSTASPARERRQRSVSAPVPSRADAAAHDDRRRSHRRRRPAASPPANRSSARPQAIGADVGRHGRRDRGVPRRLGDRPGAVPADHRCRLVDVFHVTDAGWVHDGAFAAAASTTSP